MKVSTLILTYNEAANLPACLDALTWCDDILVIDSGSIDGTTDIARAHGARVLTRAFDNFAGQRNFGLEHGALRHDWVLHLDADEVVTPAFTAALEDLTPSEGIDAWRVPSKTMLFGKWIRHAGMWPSYQVRLGHVRRLRFVQVGHGQREDLPSGRLATFPEAYLHFSFSHGMRRWLEKHVVYAQAEARALTERRRARHGRLADLAARDGVRRRRAIKSLVAEMPVALRPLAKFLYVYIFRMGFRDGRAGFVYATMLAVYEGMIAVFAYEQDPADREAGQDAATPAPPSAVEP